MNNFKILTATEWKSLCSKFSVCDDYIKVSYKEWRAATKISIDQYMTLDFDSYYCTIKISKWSDGSLDKIINQTTMNIFDMSFGSFLYDEFFKNSKKEEADMTIINATATSDNIAELVSYHSTCADGLTCVGAADTAKVAAYETNATTFGTELKIDECGVYVPYHPSNMIKKKTISLEDILAVDGTSIEETNSECINTISSGVDRVSAKIDEVVSNVESLREEVNKDKVFDKKEKETMMKGINFEFGPVNNDKIRMSAYGIAIKNVDDTYVSYDSTNHQIVNVEIFNFNAKNMMFKMPVALSAVQVGDVVIHNRKPMFITEFSNDGSNTLTCIDVYNGEKKNIIPTVNMFGFNFVTKVVTAFNMMGVNAAPSAEQPFGNMLPFMMMMNECGDEGANENKDMSPMTMMAMMTMMNGQQRNDTMGMMNPMFLAMMMDKGNDSNMGMMMAAMMMNAQNAADSRIIAAPAN